MGRYDHLRARATAHLKQVALLSDYCTDEQWDRIQAAIHRHAKTDADRIRTINLFDRITVWSNSKARRYGLASYGDLKIELHAGLMTGGELQVEHDDTLMHEVAHFLDYFVMKGDGHGPTWKQMCIAVGANPVRCGKGWEVYTKVVAAAKGLPPEEAAAALQTRWTYRCLCGKEFHRSRRWSEQRTHTACKTEPHRGILYLYDGRTGLKVKEWWEK